MGLFNDAVISRDCRMVGWFIIWNSCGR